MTRRSPPAIFEEAPTVGHWIALDDEGGITVKTGRVELGQGNLTALLQIAADELNCDVESLSITPAHTLVTPNEGFTAGSVSVSVGGAAVRWATSALRTAILQAVSKRTNVGVSELALADHRVTFADDREAFTVSSVSGDIDLGQSVVDLAEPKPQSARWRRGRSVARTDLKSRLLSAPFVHDLEFEGLLHGQPVYPPLRSARLAEVDWEALRSRPGVIDVVRDGSYLGVVAETPFAAVRAARWARANVRWDTSDSDRRDEIEIIANSREPADVVFTEGDCDSTAGSSFETMVTRPYLFHASIGPSAAVARFDGDKVTVWSHSQGVYQLRGAIAQVLDVEVDKVEVIHHPGAGCYGHNGADDAALDAVLLARSVPGRPVKVVWSRLDEFRSSPMGPGMATTVNATVDEDGNITAMRVVVNTAPHANRPGKGGTPNLLAAELVTNCIPPAKSTDMPLSRGGGGDRNAVPDYDIPNIEVQKRLVHVLPYRTSSLRSLGGFLNVVAIEAMMDDIALALSEDPIRFRLRHLSDPRARTVIEQVEALAAEVDAPAREGAGWGLGFSRYKNTSGYCAVMARVEVDDDVRVTHVASVSDIGEVVSPDGALNQIEGGIIQATSWALKERVPLDGDAIAAESWLDYPILRFSEVPHIEARLIERMNEPPLGAGEISQGPTAAAIGNALRAALGVRIKDMPMNREAILKAMS